MTIQNDVDYEAVLARIDVLMDSDPPEGTLEGDELDALVDLVQEYEGTDG